MNHAAVSYLIPAYNCADTISETVKSITEGNLLFNDEIVIVDDGSSDDTPAVLRELATHFSGIRVISHTCNKGGGAARNTAAEHARNDLLFCLDSDNVLVPGSILKLKTFLLQEGADVASFQALHYFRETIETITHRWLFKAGEITLGDCLTGGISPVASGNYLFTRQSWLRAGGYPEFAGALDAWGFGFRQLATGSRMFVMPDSFYFHRYGHESYWCRELKERNPSFVALQIMLPFMDLIDEGDVDFIMGKRGRNIWFSNLINRPLRLRGMPVGTTGVVTDTEGNIVQQGESGGWGSLLRRFFNCRP